MFGEHLVKPHFQIIYHTRVRLPVYHTYSTILQNNSNLFEFSLTHTHHIAHAFPRNP